MRVSSAREYVRRYIPDVSYPLEKPVKIGRDLYQRIQEIGPLVMGSQGEVSVFTAVKRLAQTHPEVKGLLSYSSTAIGRQIDDTVVEHPEDPWFDTIILFRPDILVDRAGKAHIGELEIIVGGAPIISLLQAYVYGEHRILDGLHAALDRCCSDFGMEGAVAFLFDGAARSHIIDHAWIPEHHDSKLLVAKIRELDFRRDGAYVRRNRLAVGYAFVRAYKRDKAHRKDEQLLRHWLDRKLVLVSPPSQVMDNKVITYLLQEEAYAGYWRQALGSTRYASLAAYLPKTYLVTEQRLREDVRLRALLAAPWRFGRFILKHGGLWGSRMVIAPPKNSRDGAAWSRRVKAMLSATRCFGPLLLQQRVDTLRLPGRRGGSTVLGATKFTPFFLYDPFTKACQNVGTSVVIASAGLRAHLSPQSTFALVEGE